ncbi:Phage tail protein [Streptomyces sp. ADI96-02]|uniref:phage tail protein n=1 Tax=unclassified Streptomyces TaxID=2593676 RepID=UPI000F553694|nr:phage tail protein [Streptomyces sp. ADI96-02]RPK67552.1 Phage tail protein [Streptomyces sp. ADI96-02]
MRAAVDGLGSPYSLVDLLPSVYQEDPFTVRLTAGWDEVIAPLISTLDCLSAYLDPRLAPEDFLAWLADRMGTQLDEKWPLERKRAVTALALSGHRIRGTVAGARERIALATGGTVELFDSGGVVTSRTPGTVFPADHRETVLVRVTVDSDEQEAGVDLDALMREWMPAHVPYRAEVVRR